MKFLCCFACALVLSLSAHATLVLGPWVPIFKGVDRLVGTNFPGGSTQPIIPRNQIGSVLRIDLTDPDVKLFTDPPCTNACPGEVAGYSTSAFLERYKVQAAINCSFFDPCCSEPQGSTRMTIRGLSISQGRVVSGSQAGYTTELLFTSNNVPTFLVNDTPPTNTAGIYTAVNGDIALVTNGVNAATGDLTVNPRVAMGISQDRRYLYLLTIDGRRVESEGATDYETAQWLLQLGVYQGLNTDGGGSTTMVMADCRGKSVPLNVPVSNPGPLGTERVVANHLGVYAKPVEGFIFNVQSVPGSTTATITWSTLAAATSQVDYGLTTNYGSFSTVDPTLTTTHSVVLTDLLPRTNYFFRVFSSTGPGDYMAVSCFSTTNNAPSGILFDPGATWKYTTANLDGSNWKAPGYSDAGWTPGTGLLWADSRLPASWPLLGAPKGTQMPINAATTYPYLTYYFRKQFTFSNSTAGATLTFSNYLDDGAVFYLNGVEVQRLYLPASPALITNTSPASGFGCSGNATCPQVFTLSGAAINNLIQGENVLAVEVHNYTLNSPDVTFGSALLYSLPPPVPPKPFIDDLQALPQEDTATLTWTTLSNSTSQVEYSLLTSTLDMITPLDSSLVTNHSVQLTGLSRLSPYYFRVLSTVGGDTYSVSGVFRTIPYYQSLVAFSNVWRYTTNNLDNQPWRDRTYNDAGWLGEGRALLYVETNPDVLPKGTVLPGVPGSLSRSYYFRTHFQITGSTAGFSLVFTNFIDDGAIFYLNGKEIQRIRMTAAPQVIRYVSLSESSPLSGDPVFPDVFRIGGDAMTNLVAGDNVLAAEVHQSSTTSSDVAFGSELGLVRALTSETRLRVTRTPGTVCVSWDGLDMTLQQTSDIGIPESWEDVGIIPIISPYCTVNPPGSVFYRLRN